MLQCKKCFDYSHDIINSEAILISCFSTFSPWANTPSALFGGQPASERLKHHTRPSPASYTDNPLLPSIHVLGCDIKIGDSDSVGRDSHRRCCFSPPSHLLFDELPDDPGHLVSVHLHHRLGHFDAFVGICHSHVQGGSIKGSFPFTARCSFIYGSTAARQNTERNGIIKMEIKF